MRILRQMLPQIQAGADHKRALKAGDRAGIKPGDVLCGVCAQVIKIHSKNPDKKFCGICQGRMNKGETALVTLDGRYMFVAPDKFLQSMIQSGVGIDIPDTAGVMHHISSELLLKHIQGQAIGILPDTMDLMEVKFKAQEDENAKGN